MASSVVDWHTRQLYVCIKFFLFSDHSDWFKCEFNSIISIYYMHRLLSFDNVDYACLEKHITLLTIIKTYVLLVGHMLAMKLEINNSNAECKFR